VAKCFASKSKKIKVKKNQCTHAQLSCLQRIRGEFRPFRLVETRLYSKIYLKNQRQ